MKTIQMFERLPYGSSTKDKLEAYSMPVTETGCWLWLGDTNNKGYGRFRVGKDRYVPHRVSYEIYIGPIPEDRLVLHRCDVRCCVNPDHLFLGTHRDNMADMVEKRRSSRGQERHKARLTENEVSEIVCLLQETAILQKDIAAKYNVTPLTICQINTGRSWAYLTDLDCDHWARAA